MDTQLPWDVIVPLAYFVAGTILLLATAGDLIPDDQKGERKR